MNATPAEHCDRHQARRDAGAPTVTTFAGPVGLSAREWRSWAGATRRPCVVTTEGRSEDVLVTWVASALNAADPIAAARRWVSAVTGRDFSALEPELQRATRYDLDTLWRTLPTDPRSPVATTAYLLLTDRTNGTALDPTRTARAVVRSLGDTGRVVRAVTELYPDAPWPALLLTPEPNSLTAALRVLETIVAAEPQVPIAVAVTRSEYEALVSRSADTRAAALAREGFVEVRGISGNELEARLRAAGVEPPAKTITRLTTDGVADDVAVAFVGAARAVRNPAPADLASDFRSVHEEFLFGQLESLPQTAGLFRPNQPLPFRHGHLVAEADLLAAELKVAVEVDGAFYHLNPDQYRRDRRKDHLYQRHGYHVLRFLAEDVVSDLERILNTILEVVAERRGPAQPPGAA